MADIAQLGIKVTSQGVDRAVAELRQLEQIGARAGAVANTIEGQARAASRGFDDMERAASRAHATLGRFIGLSISGALTTFAYGLVKAKDQILELAKVAEDNRLRPEFISGLFGAARGAGASESEITSALAKFSEVSKKTREDAEALYKALGNISPSLANAFQAAGTQEERLRLVSEAIKNTTDEVKRLQLAQEAFGTDSERILRVLGAGRDALSEYERAARAMGMAVDQDMIAKARQADQVLAQLAVVITSNLRAALVDLAPAIANVASGLGVAATEAMRFLSLITGRQGLAATSTLRARQSGGEAEIAALQAEAEGLANDRRLSATERVDAIERRIAEIRKTVRDVDSELANRGEFADPRDLRGQANERFRLSGGLAGSPRAFAARPSLTGGGGGANDNETESSAERALRQMEERNALARKELETIGMSTQQREAALAYERALNVAKRDGETLSAEQLQKLRDQSEEYGRIAEAIQKAREAQRELKALQDFAKGTFTGLFTDFAAGLQQGKSVWESFAQAGINALNKIASKLMEMAAQQIWNAAFGGSGGGGLFGNLLGGIFGGGGGGAAAGAPLNLGSFMVPSAKGNVFANDNVIPFANGGIIDRPVAFGLSGGKTGIAGEAGTEVIMPIRRTPDGRMGVAGMGGGVTASVGDTYITIQGNADEKTLAALETRLQRHKQEIFDEMPARMTSAKSARMLRSF